MAFILSKWKEDNLLNKFCTAKSYIDNVDSILSCGGVAFCKKLVA